MKKKISSHPVGIYDSGIGGLTVAHAFSCLLPYEDIIYFGDTAHLPYGEKSEIAIQSYFKNITDFLIRKQCKIIVVACHSASSACYNIEQKFIGNHVRIINVIDPMIECLQKNHQNQYVGIIGTKRTILSGIYNKELRKKNVNIQISSLPTPLLAPMIEEGFFDNQISHNIISQYLSHPTLSNIDCLALACTHYPMIKQEISLLYKQNIPILDSSEAVAQATANYLIENNLLNSTGKKKPLRQFFVSDYTPSFEACAQLFFGSTIQLEQSKIKE